MKTIRKFARENGEFVFSEEIKMESVFGLLAWSTGYSYKTDFNKNEVIGVSEYQEYDRMNQEHLYSLVKAVEENDNIAIEFRFEKEKISSIRIEITS